MRGLPNPKKPTPLKFELKITPMKLETFKTLHGISSLKFRKSVKTGRLVADHQLPIVVSNKKDKPVDFKKDLYISECTSTNGSKVFVIHNQDGWMASDVEL